MLKTVLLVDDDTLFQATIGDGLRAAGYEVAVAANGLEALERVREAPPDVILLDLIMPKLDGIRTCKLLKRHPQHRNIPIVILTGAVREGFKTLTDLGAEATVPKRQAENTLTEILQTLRLLESAPLPRCAPAEMATGLAERRIVSELLAERRHTQTLLDTLGEGVVELDERGQVVYVNPAGLGLLGWTEDEILGRSGTNLLGAANTATLQGELEKVQAGGDGETVRLELLHGQKTIGVTLTALRRPEGPSGALFVLRDLTDLIRRAQSLRTLAAVGQHILGKLDLAAVLREIVARTADLLGAERCGLFRIEQTGEQLRLRCIQSLGLSERHERDLYIVPGEAVVGKAVQDRRTVSTSDILMDPAIRLSAPLRALIREESVGAVLAAPILLPEEVFGTLTVYRPAGHRFTPEEAELVTSLAGSAAIAIENARLYGQAQTQLETIRRQHAAAQALLEVSQALTQTLDLERVFDLIAEKVLAVTGADACGISRITPSGDLEYVRAQGFSGLNLLYLTLLRGEGLMGRCLEAGAPVWSRDLQNDPAVSFRAERKARLQMRGGLAVPIVTSGGPYGVLFMGRRYPYDHTSQEIAFAEALAAQAAIAIENARLYGRVRDYSQELERRVEERTRELQALNRELEMASRHKSEFLANMSHELRTPLHGVVGFADLLLGAGGTCPAPPTAQQQHYLENIRASGARLLELINDMLDLAKVEAGRMTLDLKEVPVGAALQEAVNPAKLLALQKGLTLDLHLVEAPSPLVVDLRKFQQILGNLLSNAIKFTPGGGAITVEARPVPDPRGWALEVSVQDTGIGIAPEDGKRLFQEFVQLDNSLAKRHQGTGLGLALAKRLVKLHGGRIWAASAGRDKGATFTFRLPCRPGPLRGKVLVVEDDGEARAVIREVLAGSGLDVSEAVDGLQALALIEKAAPDVLVLDLHLPLMHGHHMIRDLRCRPGTGGLPILVVTGLGAQDGHLAVEQGADAYLTKPFAAEALVEAVERLLEREGAEALVQP